MALARPFRRLAIVNRGEAAMRLVHAVRELNEQSDEPIRLIALYTDPERHAMFVRESDEAFSIGPALTEDPEGHRSSGYLDYAALERALTATRADAAWVGWGFVAEHPEFADLCERLGIVFVGPDGPTMRRLGDKIEAKRLAEHAGVPVAPWSGGPVATAEEAARQAGEIGFPLMVKAAAGGGGRGVRRVDAAEQLAEAFEHARSEAEQAFGNDTLLIERLVTPARHIEVQIIADGEGVAWAVGVRDCTYQRRNQKVVEESASPVLTGDQEQEVAQAARRLALKAGYRNAGTVEFLYEPQGRRFSFIEVKARLQVEHPVTEMVTGLDLVKLQLHVAAGGRLEGDPPTPRGHAVEARLNAEDPALGFTPTPGRVEVLTLPTGPGVRIDTGIGAGDVIPAEFDSMVAKIIAWGRDRPESLARLRRALRGTVAVIEDGTTNHSFLLELLDRPEVRSGEVDTTWLDRLSLKGEMTAVRDADAALLRAAIELFDTEIDAERARFYAFARRGRPQADSAVGRAAEVRYRGQAYRFEVRQLGPERYGLEVDGADLEVVLERLTAHEARLSVAGRTYRTITSRQGTDLLVEVDGVASRIARDDGGLIRSHAPGVVLGIPVAPGDEVAAGDVVAVLESMKMESSLTAPFAGRVRQVLVGTNVQVPAFAPVVQLEAPDAAAGPRDEERVSFASLQATEAPPTPEHCVENLERLRRLVLGYDVADADVGRIIEDLHGACSDLVGCSPELIPGEHRVLDLYADLRALTRPQHDDDDPEHDLLPSPQEHLHAFLRSLDVGAEGLPPGYVAALERALRHYGIESLERTPALEEAGYRLFLSKQRAQAANAAVLAILDRRLELAGDLVGHVGAEFRGVLHRLEQATEGRDQIVAELAREVRYRYYDEPLIEAARDAVYAEMAEHLAALAADPHGPAREEHVRALVDCPQALAPLLTRRMGEAPARARGVLLEVMTRRYYRIRSLGAFAEGGGTGVSFGRLQYDQDGRRHHLVTAFVELEELPTALRALGEHARTVPAGEVVVADLYASRAGEAPERDALAESLRARLDQAALPVTVARVVVAIADPRSGRGMSAVELFTFRPAQDGALEEDEPLRGVHPEMGARLHLWRLEEFALQRLPSPEDVYLFRGAARTNPKDERLFALAEVRDLTPVHDEHGQISALPELERMLIEALEAMRGFQAHRSQRERLLWNRLLLDVWPVIDLELEDLRAIAARYARASAGLGIETLLIHGRLREADGTERDRVLRFFSPAGRGVVVEVDDPPARSLQPLDESARRVIAARRRGTVHPAEVVKLLRGEFREHDLVDGGRLAPVERGPALNDAAIVVGTVRAVTDRYPEGMLRVALLGDPTKALGSLAEPECRRIIAAVDFAEELGVPLEWFAISAGAKIAMDSGTENMDWIAAVLRRIIEFTQAGGELNVVVTGINVGAQPYWNAEATMLMHTRGILVMTPAGAMVLTGKQSLDYSGGVSAEDNFGIGGYERIMGPNGQAQYWAPDLAAACRVLETHYEHAYVAPGERFPRRAATSDPVQRDVRDEPHDLPGSPLRRIGDVFSDEHNPERKQPFDIRSVMRATIDRDHAPLERWAAMRDAPTAVVWDAHLGGWPVMLLGIESHPLQRHGPLPADGPEQWTSGTLFPRSSKKIARALNGASGRRPVVVLANLAGFDGSPESMRELELEFGAEIGRAVTNFRGPMVFCVVSRYHGGAFVVFSQRLNEELETVALEGARASVIGGAPAAAVVFARDVDRAARQDPRITALDAQIEAAAGAERQRLRAQRAAVWPEVHSEKVGELAARFDAVHSVERAVEMGSVSRIIPPASMRPYLVEAIERGMSRSPGGPGSERERAAVADPLAG